MEKRVKFSDVPEAEESVSPLFQSDSPRNAIPANSPDVPEWRGSAEISPMQVVIKRAREKRRTQKSIVGPSRKKMRDRDSNDDLTINVPTATLLPGVPVKAKGIIGTNLKNHVELTKLLGKGSFGSVWKAKLIEQIKAPNGQIIKPGTEIAVKIQEMQDKTFIGVATEINALRLAMKANCANVNKIYDILYDSINNTLYFLLEYLDGLELHEVQQYNQDFIDLHQAVNNKSEPNLPEQIIIDKIINPLLAALDCLHKHGIAHRDIKTENIMFANETVTLIDFGLSCIQQCSSPNIVGTPETIAPEIFAEMVNMFDVFNWINADYWSLGCTIYELVTNTIYPPQQELVNKYFDPAVGPFDVLNLFQKLQEKPDLSAIPASYTKIRKLLSVLLSKNPKTRNPGVSV